VDTRLHLTVASQRHRVGSFFTANPITRQHKQISSCCAISFPILWSFCHAPRRQIAKKNTLNNKCWQYPLEGVEGDGFQGQGPETT